MPVDAPDRNEGNRIHARFSAVSACRLRKPLFRETAKIAPLQLFWQQTALKTATHLSGTLFIPTGSSSFFKNPPFSATSIFPAIRVQRARGQNQCSVGDEVTSLKLIRAGNIF
jgi:hypothetical protein